MLCFSQYCSFDLWRESFICSYVVDALLDLRTRISRTVQCVVAYSGRLRSLRGCSSKACTEVFFVEIMEVKGGCKIFPSEISVGFELICEPGYCSHYSA
jgi:hypothetical protein